MERTVGKLAKFEIRESGPVVPPAPVAPVVQRQRVI